MAAHRRKYVRDIALKGAKKKKIIENCLSNYLENYPQLSVKSVFQWQLLPYGGIYTTTPKCLKSFHNIRFQYTK